MNYYKKENKVCNIEDLICQMLNGRYRYEVLQEAAKAGWRKLEAAVGRNSTLKTL